MTRVADTVPFESSMATPVSHKLLSQRGNFVLKSAIPLCKGWMVASGPPACRTVTRSRLMAASPLSPLIWPIQEVAMSSLRR
jgi:hypothetical protein